MKICDVYAALTLVAMTIKASFTHCIVVHVFLVYGAVCTQHRRVEILCGSPASHNDAVSLKHPASIAGFDGGLQC